MPEVSSPAFPIDLPNYRVTKVLGRGGMATVYLAEQQQPRREVVIKLVSPNDIRTNDPEIKRSFLARLRQEGDIAARFNHSNLVTVHECGIIDEHYYLVMEYLGGGDLREKLKAGIDPNEVIDTVRGIAAALGKMHRLGMLHRDLKPENVLLHEDGQPVLVDFGIAKSSDEVSTLTSLGVISGTPYYMSPERFENAPIDGRSDLYALGILFYELLTGKVPFRGDNPMAIGRAHLKQPVPRLPSTLSRFQPIIDRLLAKDPDERVQSAEEVIGALDDLAAGRPIPTTQRSDTTTCLTPPPGFDGGGNLFAELKRRNVFRVAAAYAVVAWLLIEVSDTVFPRLGLPEWTVTLVIALLILGFPLALFLAWAFELTPEGVKKAAEVHPAESITHNTGRKLDFIIIGMLAVALGWFVWDKFDTEPPPVAEQAKTRGVSIAVLPFADMSPGKDQEYFSDGIAEELLNALSRVRDLRVAGRTSSFYFRDRNEDLRTIGQALGVAYILEGSVRKSAERVRITAQLISADDGFHLWSETYDGELKDIFDLQERIARAITTELEVVLSGKQQERIVEVATENIEAYSLFLQATAIFNRRDRDRLVHASELLEEALRLDPEFTRARSRLAAVLLVTPAYASVDQPASFAAAERQAQIAITQDDRLAEPHAVLGLLFSNHRQYSAAHAEFLRALELDPADVTSNFWFGIHLWKSGYREQAVRYLDKVVKIDPMLPIGLNWRALAYLDQGDLPNARRLYQRAYDLGLVAAGTQGQGAIAELEGDRDLAARLFAQGMGRAFALPGGPDAAETFSAGLYGGPADRQKALDLIEEYLASGPEGIHGLVPNVLMRIGRPQQALELAASAPLINESLFFAPLWVRPFGDAARQSPFFPEFARRTGLAEYWNQYGPPDRCRRQADDHYVCE